MINMNLTFMGPCIVNIFSEYNQQDETFLRFIYFCTRLYKFRTVISVHYQEYKNAHTELGICQTVTATCC